MSRVVLIVPGLATPDGDSILASPPPTLRQLAEESQIVRIARPPESETPEAAFLGMGIQEGQMRQGPLTVAALGADPPTDSTHFHLSLMSFKDGIAREIQLAIPTEEEERVVDVFEMLNTKTLTLIPGSAVDHGLVWEKRGDLRMTDAGTLDGKSIREELPEGDGENVFRRLIDDSINLLSELEFNERRVDEGLPPLNLFWPWGDGVRVPVPNLALRRGEPAWVWSNSLRLRGITRLVGYRHIAATGNGINLRLEGVLQAAENEPLIAVIDLFPILRAEGRIEEADWFLREIEGRVLKPLKEKLNGKNARLTLLAPGAAGLGLVWEPHRRRENWIPFDERALEEKILKPRDLDELVEEALWPVEPVTMTG